jgi:hypothetical protein
VGALVGESENRAVGGEGNEKKVVKRIDRGERVIAINERDSALSDSEGRRETDREKWEREGERE